MYPGYDTRQVITEIIGITFAVVIVIFSVTFVLEKFEIIDSSYAVAILVAGLIMPVIVFLMILYDYLKYIIKKDFKKCQKNLRNLNIKF